MRLITTAALVAVLLAAPVRAQEAPKPCALIGKALLDMDMDSTGRINVPVTINGVAKRLMVDTGAFETLITAATATELGLKPHDSHMGFAMGMGGRTDVGVVEVAEFGIGRMKGTNYTFYVLGHEIGTSAGLLGMDFLQAFDMDFDFAKAKLNLVAPDHCAVPPYWTRQSYGVVPYRLVANHIEIMVRLDGVEVRADLDTGAADTIMSLEKASSAFDLDQKKLAKSHHYPFKTLSIGDIDVKNPAIALISDKENMIMRRWSENTQMIIGMGVLRRLHLYFSAKEKMIYVTPATQY